MSPQWIDIVSVNVGRPMYLGDRHGLMVESGIVKKPCGDEFITVRLSNIDGDGQADLVNHGGADKAVYAYPSEHLPDWSCELSPSQSFGPGAFGENLTTAGVTETSLYIGDIWHWGEVRLQVCQPRYPCFKLGMATGFP